MSHIFCHPGLDSEPGQRSVCKHFLRQHPWIPTCTGMTTCVVVCPVHIFNNNARLPQSAHLSSGRHAQNRQGGFVQFPLGLLC